MDVQVRCLVRNAYTHFTSQLTISNKFDSRYRQNERGDEGVVENLNNGRKGEMHSS